MDSKFYHFNIDIDIPQAKFFCSPLTLARGHSDLAGGTAPFGPPWLRACIHTRTLRHNNKFAYATIRSFASIDIIYINNQFSVLSGRCLIRLVGNGPSLR
jgi:hypothetical protein